MGDAVELRLDRLVDLLIAMAETEHRRPAGTVEILLARRIIDVASLAIGHLGPLARLPGGGGLRDGGHGLPLFLYLVQRLPIPGECEESNRQQECPDRPDIGP